MYLIFDVIEQLSLNETITYSIAQKGRKVNTITNKAAIDIGSNSIRLIIGHLNESHLVVSNTMKTPLRLGTDVFSSGHIGDQSLEKLLEVFFEYKKHLTEHTVEACHVVATSALREAHNAKDIVCEIYNKTGFDIDIISYEQEADYVYKAVGYFVQLKEGKYALMDIGGGSVELIECDQKQIQKKTSFPLGTVKILSQVVYEKRLAAYIQQYKQGFKDFLSSGKPFNCSIGIGGNMDCLYDLKMSLYKNSIISNQLMNPSHNHKSIHLKDINWLLTKLINMSLQERIDSFGIESDRADVLLPALLISQIFCEATDQAEIYIPKVGLKEGVLLNMLLFH